MVRCALHKENSACPGTGHGLFNYADIAWNRSSRDLFLRGKPRQQVAPAWDTKNSWGWGKKKTSTKTNFYHIPKQLNFTSVVQSSFLKWPLKKNNSVLSMADYFVLIKTFLKKTKWNIQTYQVDCVCTVGQLTQNTWARPEVWICSFCLEFLPPE